MRVGRNANSQLLLIRAIDCKLKVYSCSTGINILFVHFYIISIQVVVINTRLMN